MKRAILIPLLAISALMYGQGGVLSCDSLDAWAPREARWWKELQRATADWDLALEIQIRWQTSVCEAAQELERISLRRLQAEARNDAALADTLAALRIEEAGVRNARNAQLLASLPLEWWPAMKEVLDPPKPAVLHFGVHDRMKCEVCVPGTE